MAAYAGIPNIGERRKLPQISCRTSARRFFLFKDSRFRFRARISTSDQAVSASKVRNWAG